MNAKRFFLRLAAILFAGLVVTAIAFISWVNWYRYQQELRELNGHEPPLAFLEAVRPVPKFRIFEGFERILVTPTEEGRAEAEQLTKEVAEAKKNAKQLCQFPFYPEPFELSEADAKSFLELVLKRGTYSVHLNDGYRPDCGGFNPDAIVEWEVNGKHYHLLICLGCGELQTNIEGEGFNEHLIAYKNKEAIREILNPYFKHHPQTAPKKKMEAPSE
ncbi:MAG: hypothetical protein ACO1RA_21475 [Planctomycetaceae bacterium]